MAVEVEPHNGIKRLIAILTGNGQRASGQRPLHESDLEGITRLSEVTEGLSIGTLIIDDALRREMAGLFNEIGILRSLAQCVDDSVAAEIIGLATDRLHSPDTLQIYYESDDGTIQPYQWKTAQEENAFRDDTQRILRASVTGFGDHRRQDSRDPIIFKGDALARSMRVLHIVPFRSVVEIQHSSTVPEPAILFRVD